MKTNILIGFIVLLTTNIFYHSSIDPGYITRSVLCTMVSEIRLFEPPQSNGISDFVCLQPGDIILTKRFGYASNLFIHGSYTHAALYLGSSCEFQMIAATGSSFPEEYNHSSGWVAESLNDGVQITNVQHVLDADEYIILRPLLPREIKNRATHRAITMIGIPYDFNFNFDTGDKISCTELIWRSYESDQLFSVNQLFGNPFTTPDEIASEAFQMKNSLNPQLEIVLIKESDNRSFEQPSFASNGWSTYSACFQSPKVLFQFLFPPSIKIYSHGSNH